MPWDELRYVIYARTFGWTPEQVDALTLDIEPWILPINAAIDADHANRQKQAQAAADAKAKRGGRHRR